MPLLLGGELGNSALGPGIDEPALWSGLAARGLNFVLVPVLWELFEPEEGTYDPAYLDRILTGARGAGLGIGLLWFATWKNSMSCAVPSWVNADPGRFPRALTRSGRRTDILSALAPATLEADARAFAALAAHLAAADPQGTVKVLQVENEIGLLPDPRESGPEADRLWAGSVPQDLLDRLTSAPDRLEPELRDLWAQAGSRPRGTWAEVFGTSDEAAEVFQAWHYARFTDQVAAAGRRHLDRPHFVNAALNRAHQRPGEYPSGGPLPHLIDVWKAGAPHLDFLAPDHYWGDYETWCRRYDRPDNRLFVPECLRGADNPAQALVALGRHGALGFCPFAVEDMTGPEADLLAQTYRLLARAEPILEAHRGRTWGALVTKERPVWTQVWGSVEVKVKHDGTLGWNPEAAQPKWVAGGAILVPLAENELLVVGTGIVVTFSPAPGARGEVGLDRVEEGSWDEGRWQPRRRLTGDETHQGRHVRIPVGQVGAQRVRLFRY